MLIRRVLAKPRRVGSGCAQAGLMLRWRQSQTSSALRRRAALPRNRRSSRGREGNALSSRTDPRERRGSGSHKQAACTDTGTPQGGIISPLLANIALDGMERLFDAEKRDGRPKRPCFRRGPNQGVSLIRYADDFIVTAPTRECLEDYVKPKLEAFLATRGLAFSEAKTHVVNVDDGFDFLGFTIRKLSGKLLTRPQKEKMLAYLRGIGQFLRENRQAPTAVVIKQLIPVIRGWSAYYRHGASSRAFSYADHRLWMMLWSWAKRRHPTKSLVWVKRRYFARARGRDWTFYWGTSGKIGMTLPRHCDMPFIRHIKVAGRNSPLNPNLRAYWDARRAVRLEKESYSKRRKQLLKLQGHVCAQCGVPFDPDDDKELMQVQRIKPRRKAGDNTDRSPLLVHRWCHHQHQRSGNHAAEA
jgi:RNA-directed DNA polymerase